MARVVKEQEHAIKRKDILDATQRLVYAKGYEGMSIQDIINDLKMSKGAFYHYYASKQDLLKALIEQMVQDAELVILPIVQNPQLSALEKVHGLFDASARWKTARKDYLLALMQGWYADENVLVREKAQSGMIRHFSPMLADIIRQGVAEGVMNTRFPDQIADMAFALLVKMGDTYMDLLFDDSSGQNGLQRALDLVNAYNDALERMLGAAAGSMNLVDKDTLKEWFVLPAGKA
jgi:TetR/AcrR family transcriptional repressor of nem operon